jgi:hypothetical protein
VGAISLGILLLFIGGLLLVRGDSSQSKNASGPVGGSDAGRESSNPLDYPGDSELGVVPNPEANGGVAAGVSPGSNLVVDPNTGQLVQIPGMGNPSNGGGNGGNGATTTSVPAVADKKITCKASFIELSNGSENRKFASVAITGAAIVWAEFAEDGRKSIKIVDTRSGFAIMELPNGMTSPRLTVFGDASLDPASTGCAA